MLIMNEKKMDILEFQKYLLRFFLVWPKPNRLNITNNVIIYGYFFFFIVPCALPMMSAFIFQLQQDTWDVNIILDALICILNYAEYILICVTFAFNDKVIEKHINFITHFLIYCDKELIVNTDIICKRYMKYMLVYILYGLIFVVTYPLIFQKQCIIDQNSEFMARHDPCGMPTHNYYPFDATDPKIFGFLFFTEVIGIIHFCHLSCIVFITIIGVLMHITSQLEHCGYKFKNLNYNSKNIHEEFSLCVEYHQDILKYGQKTFALFSNTVAANVTLTSVATAVIAYQLVTAANYHLRFKYTMLLNGWALLLFLICLYAQKMEDMSVTIAMSIYESNWYSISDLNIRRKILMVIVRSQSPLTLKLNYFGAVSLRQFVAVMKSAYSLFTLLVTVTN